MMVFQGTFVPTTSAACTSNTTTKKRSEGSGGYLAAWTAFGRKMGLE